MGNAETRNTALRNCNGYYVAFMDDDDEWIDNDKLKKQVEIFESNRINNLGIVCPGVRLFSDNSKFRDKLFEGLFGLNIFDTQFFENKIWKNRKNHAELILGIYGLVSWIAQNKLKVVNN